MFDQAQTCPRKVLSHKQVIEDRRDVLLSPLVGSTNLSAKKKPQASRKILYIRGRYYCSSFLLEQMF